MWQIDEDGDKIFIPDQSWYQDMNLDPIHPCSSRCRVFNRPLEDSPSSTDSSNSASESPKTPPKKSKSRKKSVRKSPKTKYGIKTTRIRSPDPEMAFLDSVIAENKVVIAGNRKSPPNTKPQKKEPDANANHLNEIRARLREKKGQLRNNRSAFRSTCQPSRSNIPVIEEYVSEEQLGEAGVNELNERVMNMLTEQYSEAIVRKEITMQEAIRRIFKEIRETTGAEIDDTEYNEIVVNSSKLVDIILNGPEPGDQGIIEVDFAEEARLATRLKTFDLEYVEKCLHDPIYLKSASMLRDFDEKMGDSDLNRRGWESMCKVIYDKFSDKVQISIQSNVTNPVVFYEEILKQYMAQAFINTLVAMDGAKVFDKYDPQTEPLVIGSFQKDIGDIFPHVEYVFPLQKLIEEKIVPRNAGEFTPFGKKPLAFGLFWGYGSSFSLFGAFYRDPDNHTSYNYYWVVYNRILEDIDTILRGALNIVKEPVVIENETSVDFNREGEVRDISVTFTDEKVMKETAPPIELGSTFKLHAALDVDYDKLTEPGFMESCMSELSEISTAESLKRKPSI